MGSNPCGAAREKRPRLKSKNYLLGRVHGPLPLIRNINNSVPTKEVPGEAGIKSTMKYEKEHCSFEGCPNLQSSKFNYLCNGHTQQERKGKELTPLGTTFAKFTYGPDAQCIKDGCSKRPEVKWMCMNHYQQYRYHKGEAGKVKDLERRCTTCRQVKHWTKFARFETSGSSKLECLVCFKARMNPPKEKSKEVTTEDLLRMIEAQQQQSP